MAKFFLRNFSFFTLFLMAFSAFAAENQPKICMVLDKGGKDDHSFNEAAVIGFNKALKEGLMNKNSKFVEPHTDEQIAQFFNHFASGADCDLIVSIGFNPSTYLLPVSTKFPDKKYLAIDTNLGDTSKNIRSVTFEEHEGSFLVGAIAAMKSSSQKIGFVGGMDIPLIHRFELAYKAGAEFINPKVSVVATYIGVTADSWNNPSKAKELALSQYKNNVDVIYQVAAASGKGVFDAAEEENTSDPKIKHYAIGVDLNQNWINPSVILTSMMKKVDTAVFLGIKDFADHKFTTGHVSFGLKAGGVDWAYDNDNKKFFTKKDLEKINQIKAGILSGKIVVPDYYKIMKNK